jgi:transposase
VVIEPETRICQCCAGKLRRISEDIGEVLDIVPAILRVLLIIRTPSFRPRLVLV